MKPKTMILMVVAIGCGLGASFLTSQMIQGNTRAPVDDRPRTRVIKAKDPVPSFITITDPKKYFVEEEIFAADAPANAIVSLDRIKDQRLSIPIPTKGTILTEEYLVKKDQNHLDLRLQPGHRAVAIRVNPKSLAGGYVLPGSLVDVVLTTRGTDPVTEIVLQNMQVLACDEKTQRTAEQGHLIAQTVTLAAKPEEALRLENAGANGELTLMVKNKEDKETINTASVKFSDLRRPLDPTKTAIADKLKEEEMPPASATPTYAPGVVKQPEPPIEEKKVDKTPVVKNPPEAGFESTKTENPPGVIKPKPTEPPAAVVKRKTPKESTIWVHNGKEKAVLVPVPVDPTKTEETEGLTDPPTETKKTGPAK